MTTKLSSLGLALLLMTAHARAEEPTEAEMRAAIERMRPRPTPPEPRERVERRARTKLAVGGTLLGLGAMAVVAGFGSLFVYAGSGLSGFGCENRYPGECASAARVYERQNQPLLGGGIAGLLGGALAIGGGATLVASGKADRRLLTVAPSFGDRAAGLVVAGRF